MRATTDVARASGMRVLGPNTIGAANFARRAVSAATANIPLDLEPGALAVVSQSGSVGTTILAALRRYGVGVGGFVALGNEADVSVSP